LKVINSTVKVTEAVTGKGGSSSTCIYFLMIIFVQLYYADK